MRRLMLVGFALSFAFSMTASAAPCRNDKGKFVTCHAAPAKKCRDAKGRFMKCMAMPGRAP